VKEVKEVKEVTAERVRAAAEGASVRALENRQG